MYVAICKNLRSSYSTARIKHMLFSVSGDVEAQAATWSKFMQLWVQKHTVSETSLQKARNEVANREAALRKQAKREQYKPKVRILGVTASKLQGMTLSQLKVELGKAALRQKEIKLAKIEEKEQERRRQQREEDDKKRADKAKADKERVERYKASLLVKLQQRREQEKRSSYDVQAFINQQENYLAYQDKLRKECAQQENQRQQLIARIVELSQ